MSTTLASIVFTFVLQVSLLSSMSSCGYSSHWCTRHRILLCTLCQYCRHGTLSATAA